MVSEDNTVIVETIEDLISDIGTGPLMIHADLLRATFGKKQSLCEKYILMQYVEICLYVLPQPFSLMI